MFGFIGLPALVIAFAMLVGIAKYTLGPISQAAGYLKAPTRFRLSDFVWFICQIQVVLATCAQSFDLDDPFGFAISVSFFLLAATAMWVGAVSCVSKAGVTDPWRRGIFILFQLPLTLFFMFAIPFCLVTALYLLLRSGTAHDPNSGQLVGLYIVGLFAASILLGAASWGLRHLSTWVLQDSAWAKEQQSALAASGLIELQTLAPGSPISMGTSASSAVRRLPRISGASS